MHCKEGCLVTPTGFAANTSLLAALGAIASCSAAPARPAAHQKIAVFSDALNHASIIDGLRMMERQHQAIISVYKHSDMHHLDELLSNCPNEKKVVITDRWITFLLSFYPFLSMLISASLCGSHFLQPIQHGRWLCSDAQAGGVTQEAPIFACCGRSRPSNLTVYFLSRVAPIEWTYLQKPLCIFRRIQRLSAEGLVVELESCTTSRIK